MSYSQESKTGHPPWRTCFVIHLLADTGIRRGECCGLQWKVVDFQNNLITITGNLCYAPDKGIYLDTPKNGKTRTIDIAPEVTDLLRQLRLEQASHAISSFVFTQENSPEPMHPQSPTRYLKQFSKRYGIPGLHPHKLRHSFASVAITNGADVASVSEKLGHGDKAVTLRMYTQCRPGKHEAGQPDISGRPEKSIIIAGWDNPTRLHFLLRMGFYESLNRA